MRKLLFVGVCLMVLATSCIRVVSAVVVGNGQVTTTKMNYDAEGVRSLALSSGFNVVFDKTIEPGTVQITTYENVVEYVVVDVSNGSLEIKMKPNVSYDIDVLEARLSPEGFTVFAVSGGVDLSSVESLQIGSEVVFAASGGADIDLSLSCLNLVLAVSGGANVDFNELSANDINLAVSGGADVEMNGVCNALKADVSGGADVELGGLRAKSVVADASGGADLEVFAIDSYELKASGAADVEYHETGAKVDADSSSAADISVVR